MMRRKTSMINYKILPEYTINRIENIMSLRIPQKQSLKISESILDDVQLSKNVDVKKAASLINGVYPTFKNFEHEFMSLAFALATGVGITKLMGAFMTYLYTNKNIRNFFVVAPNLTIYDKLKNDLGNPSESNEKYVFKGVSCFAVKQPNVWIDDDYRNRPARSLTDSDSINIYIFNISKFNSEDRKISDVNEYLGESFIDYLKSMEDLVLIMDESHHYRAKASFNAINELNPVLGIELTATPQIQSNSKTKYFENVVYEYPLSKAIRDGYTRTPYAMTRQDFQSYNLDEEELDKLMINDGIKHHEIIKQTLKQYAINNELKTVKPFMLIVCKNTPHANKVMKFIKSDGFKDGKYKDKVIMIHSKQRGEEKEDNIRLLLDVEKHDNPVEIVIHVNILKEGWDVNNLYTIVPLRTATSKTLREQTVGRGLRLPYGKLTGEQLLDAVTLTAHDKFEEIINEAQREDSIFKADGVIYAEYQKELKKVPVYQQLFTDNKQRDWVLKETGLDYNNKEHKNLYDNIENTIASKTRELIKEDVKVDKEEVKKKIVEDPNVRYKENTDVQMLIDKMFDASDIGEIIIEESSNRTMFIPRLKSEFMGEEKYIIRDFDLDLSDMVYVPIAQDVIIKSMLDSRDKEIVIKGDAISLDTYNPGKRLIEGIRGISDINYEKCSTIIIKIVKQFLAHYREKYNEEEVKNIIWGNYRDIISKFKSQLLANLAISYEGMVEVVEGINTTVIPSTISFEETKDLMEKPDTGVSIKTLVYTGGRKSVYSPFKFDSDSERVLANVCENSPEVIQWLRPQPTQFNITYDRGKRYEPDFVIETKDKYYLVEVKAENQLKDPVVIAKKERAIEYCIKASEYNLSQGHKPFECLFIPANQIMLNTSFNVLVDKYKEK